VLEWLLYERSILPVDVWIQVLMMRYAPNRLSVLMATIAAVAVMAIACTPGPLSKPTSPAGSGGPMNKPVALGGDTGSGAIENVRQQLMGTWELTGLEMVPPKGGARVPVKATGSMTYDQFGNLEINARTNDPAAPVAAREVDRLSFKGRAVIDVTNKELKLMDLKGNVDPNEVISPDLRRKYEFDTMETLKLSTFDASGTVTAVTSWRRVKQ
jgi:hypothetical protein